MSITFWPPPNVLQLVLPLLAAECPELKTLTLTAGSLQQHLAVKSLQLSVLRSLKQLQTLCLTDLSHDLLRTLRGLSSLSSLKTLRVNARGVCGPRNLITFGRLTALEELCVIVKLNTYPYIRIDFGSLSFSKGLGRLTLEDVHAGYSLQLQHNTALTSLRLQNVDMYTLLQIPNSLRDLELYVGRSGRFEAQGASPDLKIVVMKEVNSESASRLMAAATSITSLTLNQMHPIMNLVAQIVANLPALVSLNLDNVSLDSPLPDLSSLRHLRHLRIWNTRVPDLSWLQHLCLLHTLTLASIARRSPSPNQEPPLDISQFSSLQALTLLKRLPINTKRLSLLTDLRVLSLDLACEPKLEVSSMLAQPSNLDLHKAVDEDLPPGLRGLPSLHKLKDLTLLAGEVDMNRALPYIKQVTSLTKLHIKSGPHIASMSVTSFPTLQELVLEGFLLRSFLEVQGLPSLKIFTLEKVEFLEGRVTLQNLPRLERIVFRDMLPTFKTFVIDCASLVNIAGAMDVEFRGCPRLAGLSVILK